MIGLVRRLAAGLRLRRHVRREQPEYRPGVTTTWGRGLNIGLSSSASTATKDDHHG